MVDQPAFDPSSDERILRIARAGNAEAVEQYVLGYYKDSVAVNVADPATGATPLHFAAAYGSRRAFRALIKASQCDVLLRDKKGRLASELAGVYGHDPAMARLLMMMEARQARERGLPPPRRREKRA